MSRRVGAIFAASLAAALLACGGEGGEPAAAPAASPAAVPARSSAEAPGASAEAEQIFATRCATCHGQGGAGDGPGSAGLTPAPRDFRDAAWQASVDDSHLQKIIVYGGAAVARSPVMPGNPDLMAKPDVVAALVVHIRSLSSE